jgi:Glycosyl transferase family 2
VKFSVVVPLYNKAPYVESALRSVLEQTVTDFEIIVVDDGSIDHGAALVKAMADPRIRLVSQANGGVSRARNAGIALAQGEWVAFLDADDWLHPAYFASLLEAQKQYPDADVVATQFMTIPHTYHGVWPPKWRLPACPFQAELIVDLPRRWMKSPTLHTSAVSVRTSRLANMQPCFAPGESVGEDIDLWLRLGEVSPIVLISAPLAAYRSDVENSLSGAIPPLIVPAFMHRMLDRARGRTGQMNRSNRQSLLMLASHIEITLAREALAAGQRGKAIKMLLGNCHAGRSRRWWSTAAMVIFFPGRLVQRWESWRVRRMSSSLTPG